MIKGDRDTFLGVHLTHTQKETLRAEAAHREMSMSELVAKILDSWLRGVAAKAVNKPAERGPNGERIIDGLREIPLPLEEK